jgi:hypothetical protein
MPAISLVVCLHRQRDLLERLLHESQGHYDDLVVVHDGPDDDHVREIVDYAGGRFFVPGKREFQQEPHWPFAWAQAKYDWILRLDADEFPSAEMNKWLQEFRRAPEPSPAISGYTCIWPMWNGRREITKKWPAGRHFLFHRMRVKFFGMAEQTPIPSGDCKPLAFTLHHHPHRKSYGLHNILIRKQAYVWRERIAVALLGQPTDLPCWRWESSEWPPHWEQIRQRPIWTAFDRILRDTLRTLRDQWRAEGKIFPSAALNTTIHHALICLKYWRIRRHPPKPSKKFTG